MKIAEDILEAIQSGAVPQPFSAEDLARALDGKDWSRGSFATLLSRYAQARDNSPALVVRVSRGRYRLAANPATVRR